MSVLLSLFYFFYFALVAVYIVFLPKILSTLGYSAMEIGILFSTAPLVRFLLPFIFRKFGGPGEFSYSISLLSIFVATVLFLPTIDDFVYFLSVNILYGASMGVVLPYVDTVALGKIGKESYGRVRLWGSIGFMLVAVWLSGRVEDPTEALYHMVVFSLFVTASGWYIGGLRRSIHRDMTASASKETAETDRGFSLSKYWAFWFGTFLLQVSFGGFYNFFTIYETEHGLTLQDTGWLWSFGVLCEIAMLYFQGPLLRRNLLSLIEFATFITSIRWILLWLYPGSWGIAMISQSFHAISFALYYTAAISYIYSLYREKRLAQQFFLGISFGLGGSVGAVVSGFIYDRWPQELFLSQALIAMLSWSMIMVHSRRKERYADS